MSVKFPANLVEPIRQFLHLEESKLKHRKAQLDKQDPFNDDDRMGDSAVDDDASELFGHSNVVGMKAEIDRRLVQIRKALTRIKIGKYGICEKCGKMIDTDRLTVFPEATICVSCKAKREKK